MSEHPPALLFRGKLASGVTQYVEIPVRESGGARFLGAHVTWPDAVSSATITLELTSYRHVAATTPGAANDWTDSGLTFTGPAASAAGGLLINVENIRQRRARLKIVTAAISQLDVLDGTAP